MKPLIKDILRATSEITGLSHTQIQAHTRAPDAIIARVIFWGLAHEFGWGCTAIGRIANRDRTSIAWTISRKNKHLSSWPGMKSDMELTRQRVHELNAIRQRCGGVFGYDQMAKVPHRSLGQRSINVGYSGHHRPAGMGYRPRLGERTLDEEARARGWSEIGYSEECIEEFLEQERRFTAAMIEAGYDPNRSTDNGTHQAGGGSVYSTVSDAKDETAIRSSSTGPGHAV